MNQQDRYLLKEVHGLNHKEQNKAFTLVRTGRYTLDQAAKFVIKDRKKHNA